MRIAPVKRSDVAAAKHVIASVVLEYYFAGRYTTEELLVQYEKTGYLADLDQLEEVYDGHRGILLGAFDGETLVGTGGVRQLDADTGELVRLWLLRNYRSRGVGREMTEELLQFASHTNWRRLRLETSLHCKEALSLFGKLGFREAERYKESIGNCFMQLDLPRRTNRVAGGD